MFKNMCEEGLRKSTLYDGPLLLRIVLRLSCVLLKKEGSVMDGGLDSCLDFLAHLIARSPFAEVLV